MVLAEKHKVVIKQNIQLDEDIYSMWLEDSYVAKNAKAGQFVSLYLEDGSSLLPRPISICEIDKELGRIRLVYRVVGKGTLAFSTLKGGDEITVMGPLGNGFHLEGKNPLLIGGGIGIPPMLELVKQLDGEKKIVLGYRDSIFMSQEFEQYGKVYISTEDGSAGTKGNVIDAIFDHDIRTDMIYACGPTPMLRAIQAYAKEKGMKAQLSLEERMACGIGACLGCVCKSTERDHHTNVNNKRICKDGPVFYADEVEL